MFIKLTRFDNVPVWINAAFVVTVEPRRQSVGSIVVPIGDGLDYEVRESPEEVLAMLDGAPVAPVVPVPPPKSLTKTPDDVSAEPLTTTAADVLATVESVAPVKDAPVAPSAADPAVPRKGARKAVHRSRAKKSVPVAIADEQLERLRKMAPGSVKKLANTISSQLKLDDPDSVIADLAGRGVLTLDHDHVAWN